MVVVVVGVGVMVRAASFVVVDGRIPFYDNGNMNMEEWKKHHILVGESF
jgi:hypothetical protein